MNLKENLSILLHLNGSDYIYNDLLQLFLQLLSTKTELSFQLSLNEYHLYFL